MRVIIYTHVYLIFIAPAPRSCPRPMCRVYFPQGRQVEVLLGRASGSPGQRAEQCVQIIINTYVLIFIYIYMYIYICIHICICICICTCTCLCIGFRTPWATICYFMWFSYDLHICIHIYIYICLCTHICIHMCVATE